jgi:DNA-binding MarR family transcriptional regulator
MELSMAMRPEDIPRRQERVILADATFAFATLVIKRFFRDTEHLGTFIDVAHVMRALWSSTCRGQALTAEQIGYTIGMPRETVRRKLDYLVKRGYVRKIESTYAISDETLLEVTPHLDQAINLICDTADALRAAQNGQEKLFSH